MLQQRRLLRDPEAPPRKSHYRPSLRHGEPYLRSPNGVSGLAGGVPGACRLRCRELAFGVELEGWVGTHARRRGSDLLDRNDYLRSPEVIWNIRFQGYVAAFKVVTPGWKEVLGA